VYRTAALYHYREAFATDWAIRLATETAARLVRCRVPRVVGAAIRSADTTASIVPRKQQLRTRLDPVVVRRGHVLSRAAVPLYGGTGIARTPVVVFQDAAQFDQGEFLSRDATGARRACSSWTSSMRCSPPTRARYVLAANAVAARRRGRVLSPFLRAVRRGCVELSGVKDWQASPLHSARV
jgi:hypothetical protein